MNELSTDPARRSTVVLELSELTTLARNSAADARQQLLAQIAPLFIDNTDTLSETEQALFADIIKSLIEGAEREIREDLANRLQHVDNIDQTLITYLANDEISIASPILAQSPVLRDSQLLEIIRHRGREHQIAIANRRRLSPEITEALIDTGDERVVLALVKNNEITITRATLEYLTEEAERLTDLQQPLLARHDLTHELACQLFAWVGAALRHHILSRWRIDPTTLDRLTSESARKAAQQDEDPEKAFDLAQKLRMTGADLPKHMIHALRHGHVRLYYHLLAQHAEIAPRLARRLVMEDLDGRLLVLIARATGISKSTFLKLREMSRAHVADSPLVLARLTRQSSDLYDRTTADESKTLLALCRLDRVYVEAVLMDAVPSLQLQRAG